MQSILWKGTEKKYFVSERQAIETTIQRTGSALYFGFDYFLWIYVLFMSPMPLVRNFGIITAATIVGLVVIAIFVLQV